MGIGESERPGPELPKDYRKVVKHLIEHQEWRYTTKKKHPTLYPPDRTKRPLTLAKTPSDRRGWENFLAAVRKRGGKWPPDE